MNSEFILFAFLIYSVLDNNGLLSFGFAPRFDRRKKSGIRERISPKELIRSLKNPSEARAKRVPQPVFYYWVVWASYTLSNNFVINGKAASFEAFMAKNLTNY